VQRLQNDILSGKYRPGDRLNESFIAREYSISRIPVREALFQLRESGMVMQRERRGMFVTALSEQEVEQITTVRILLETEAFLQTRRVMTPRTAQELGALVERMESAHISVPEAAALDLQFHRRVWELSGNEYLRKVLDPIATLLFAHNTLERVGPINKDWRLNHHRKLLNVLTSTREPDVKAALIRHTADAYRKPLEPEAAVKPAKRVAAPSKAAKPEPKPVRKRKK
jgi:DNA-binding GntR family transcriptional regulator